MIDNFKIYLLKIKNFTVVIVLMQNPNVKQNPSTIDNSNSIKSYSNNNTL